METAFQGFDGNERGVGEQAVGHAPEHQGGEAVDGLDDEAMYEAVRRRDAMFEGRFVYGVRTTRVYCRPGCGARLPLRGNVSFHPDGAAAERAGLRACLRCRPDAEGQRTLQAAMVERACRLIERAETPPRLAELATRAGLSRFHFHRVFRAVTGVMPASYASARRAERLRAALAVAPSATRAIHEAGFNAASRCYADAPGRLGMTPGAYRRGAPDTQVRFAVGPCTLGQVLVAATAIGLCAIWLGDDAAALVRALRARFPHAELVDGDAAFVATVARVVRLVDGAEAGFALPLDIRGTAFQQRVWRALLEIPPGGTVTYAGLAASLGLPGAARAVAGACAANQLAVAIPCHRVIRLGGAVSGYRWGPNRKKILLAREST